MGDVRFAKVALEFGVSRHFLQVVTILAADVSRIAVRVINLRQIRVTRGLVLAGVDLRVLSTRGWTAWVALLVRAEAIGTSRRIIVAGGVTIGFTCGVTGRVHTSCVVSTGGWTSWVTLLVCLEARGTSRRMVVNRQFAIGFTCGVTGPSHMWCSGSRTVGKEVAIVVVPVALL